jgi:hypothetical protein
MGSVTFLDGETVLGTVALKHGRAKLRMSAVSTGTDAIEVIYNPGHGMLASAATILENFETRSFSPFRSPTSDD